MTFTKAVAASLALLATQAHGMTLSSRGVGQVLIYPYYTVNDHQQTMFSFTNATEVGKALQLTFREGYDGRVVYAQRVFLGPNQSWSASVFALRDIGVESDSVGIASRDAACVQTLTNPATKTMRSGLVYHAFDPASYTGANLDGGPTVDSRMHEGFIEVIELGQLGGDTAAVISPRNSPTPDCSVVVPFIKMLGDFGTPTGGLSGSAAVVDVAQGTFFEFEPQAIDGFRVQRLVPPALADLSMAGDDGKATVSASIEYHGTYLTTTFPRSRTIDAVSSLFMASSLTGEFDNSLSIGAATDWVLTFPTKQFYVDNTYKSSADVRPFEKRFGDAPAGSAPVANYYAGYSRDGYDLARNWCGFGECPPIGPTVDLQTKVASFVPSTRLDSSAVLGSALVTTAPIAPDHAGTATMTFTGRMNASNEGYVLDGLPVIGLQAIQYVNGNVAGGVLSNYSGTAPLRSTLDCEAAMGCH